MNFVIVEYIELACTVGVTQKVIYGKLCFKRADKPCRNARGLILHIRFVKTTRLFKVSRLFGNE